MLLSVCVGNIRLAGSRKEKIALFQQYLEEVPLFGEMVKLAMDTSIAFNVGKNSVVPPAVPLTPLGALSPLCADDFNTLRLMAARKLNRTKGAEWANNRCKTLIPEEAKLLVCILDKDLSWGLGASSINAAVPGFLFEFSCMLAVPFDASKIKFPCRIEPKFDGMRVLAIVESDTVSFYTRSGKPVDSLSEKLVENIKQLASHFTGPIVIDGEIMGASFKETMQKARRKSQVFEDANYHVFDWLPKGQFLTLGHTAFAMPYKDRRAMLEKVAKALKGVTNILVPASYLVSSEEEVTVYYDAFRDAGYEGGIIKDLNGHYFGKRHAAWIKMKAEETEDLEIIGFEEGEGKFVGTLGALIVDRKGVPVRVGSGISDEDRKIIWSNRDTYRHKVAEVQFQEVTEAGSLRHPRFVTLRMDKSEW